MEPDKVSLTDEMVAAFHRETLIVVIDWLKLFAQEKTIRPLKDF